MRGLRSEPREDALTGTGEKRPSRQRLRFFRFPKSRVPDLGEQRNDGWCRSDQSRSSSFLFCYLPFGIVLEWPTLRCHKLRAQLKVSILAGRDLLSLGGYSDDLWAIDHGTYARQDQHSKTGYERRHRAPIHENRGPHPLGGSFVVSPISRCPHRPRIVIELHSSGHRDH
jgi:hypothetical protein